MKHIPAIVLLCLLAFSQSSIGQSRIDSLYSLLKIQSFGFTLVPLGDNFAVIGHGTDTVPFNSYGKLFSLYDYYGNLLRSNYALDPGKSRYAHGQNAVLRDSIIYTTFNGDAPVEIIGYDMLSGDILKRKSIENSIGSSAPFTQSIHLLDTNTLIVNSIATSELQQRFTQLCIYDQEEDTIGYKILFFQGWEEIMSDMIITPDYYIFGGMLLRGQLFGSKPEFRSTIAWYNKNFEEVRRYTSSEQKTEGFGNDMLLLADNSIVYSNKIGQVLLQNGFYYAYWRPAIYKVDSLGNLLWSTPLGKNLYFEDESIEALIESNGKDGFIAAGYQTNFDQSEYYSPADTNQFGENMRWEGLVTKISPEGDSVWSRYYYKSDFLFSRTEFYDIIPHPEGGYLITGYANKGPIVEGQTAIYTLLLHVDEYGCSVPGCHETVDVKEIGVLTGIQYYPNPGTNELHIYQPDRILCNYSIISSDGLLMDQFQISHEGVTVIVDTPHYPVGNYFILKMSDKGERKTEQWSKAK